MWKTDPLVVVQTIGPSWAQASSNMDPKVGLETQVK
jgi:hypothetical protein